jgi:uncharacterized membrane protein
MRVIEEQAGKRETQERRFGRDVLPMKAGSQGNPRQRGYARANRPVNVHQLERAASVLVGVGLLVYAAKRLSLRQAPVALAGGALLYRGAFGYCPAYGALRVSTVKRFQAENDTEQQGATAAARREQAVVVEQSVTIGRSPGELYALWREPHTLSRVMAVFANVSQTGDGETHWSVRLPLQQTVRYSTRVAEEREPTLVRWTSSSDASGLGLEGALKLKAAPRDWGTEVTLRMSLQVPGGTVGRALAKALGPAPKLVVQKALRRFKSLAETGEIPSLNLNPAARQGGRDQ